MYLYINTALDKMVLALIDKDGNILKLNKIAAKYQQSEKLLVNIHKLVGKNLKKLKGIIAVKGPGSFTALRIGVTTANTLAWSLQIPVVDVELDNGSDKELIKEGFNKLLKIKKFKFILPAYGQEPNISKPKK